jgi:hypothetical protein
MQLYHRPIGAVRTSIRNGGPIAQWQTERNRREMERAAALLPPLPRIPGEPIVVHLMTGRRFWYQTAFCLYSLAQASSRPVVAEIYDDGSLDATCIDDLQRLGLELRFHPFAELRQKVERELPRDRFPSLRDRWEKYPNIRKLIDVHVGSSGWKLVIDSDLIFFRRPDALIDWLSQPNRLLHAIDTEESYGYSRPLLELLAGAPLPARLNVGLCGLRSDQLDWPQLEAWTTELQRCEHTNYYLEQALVAMLAATEPCVAVPESDYITLPDRAEVVAPRAVMHHYVATAKRWYFRYGWRHVLPSAPFVSTSA